MDRWNQMVALGVLGVIAVVALWVARDLLLAADTSEQITAGAGVVAVASGAVGVIGGFIAGRVTRDDE